MTATPSPTADWRWPEPDPALIPVATASYYTHDPYSVSGGAATPASVGAPASDAAHPAGKGAATPTNDTHGEATPANNTTSGGAPISPKSDTLLRPRSPTPVTPEGAGSYLEMLTPSFIPVKFLKPILVWAYVNVI